MIYQTLNFLRKLNPLPSDGPSVWIDSFVNREWFSDIHYHAEYRDHSRDYNGL